MNKASERLEANMVLDTKGDLCPMPIIKTSKAILQIQLGQILEVLSTDPASKPDMEAWSRTTGHQLLSHHVEEGSPKVYVFHIRRVK